MDDSANFDNPPGGSRGGSGGGLSEWTKDNFGGGHKTSAKALTTNPSSELNLGDYGGVVPPPGSEGTFSSTPGPKLAESSPYAPVDKSKPMIVSKAFLEKSNLTQEVLDYGKRHDPRQGQVLRQLNVLPEDPSSTNAFLKGSREVELTPQLAERTLSEIGRGIFENHIPPEWSDVFNLADDYFNDELARILLKGNPTDAVNWNNVFKPAVTSLITSYVDDGRIESDKKASRSRTLAALRPLMQVLLGPDFNAFLDEVQWPKAAVPGEVSR